MKTGTTTQVSVDVQYASIETLLPTYEDICAWVDSTLVLVTGMKHISIHTFRADAEIELVVRIVDERESCALNQQYRGRSKATNVLSFPYCNESDISDINLLGDIVVCAPIVKREADIQNKKPRAHWAHMVVHGVLHLLGFNHESTSGARQMESLETVVLARLEFPDPYYI